MELAPITPTFFDVGAMRVQVIPDGDSRPVSESADFVRVRTQTDPHDDTVVLATIERVVEKAHLRRVDEPAWHVRTLVLEAPMAPDMALGLATRYAERKQIPVVVAPAEDA